MIFYDTCALLNKMQEVFNEPFEISAITLKELENIKTSAIKDSEIKFRARKLLHLLEEKENLYHIVLYLPEWDKDIENIKFLPLTDDSRIIMSAIKSDKEKDPITFITDDLCCKNLAKAVGLKVNFIKEEEQEYTGYRIITYDTEDSLAQIYSNLFDSNYDWNMNINEYLLIQDKNNEIIDKYKYTESGFIQVPFIVFNTRMYGRIKPKDAYQAIAMDSLKENQITMIRGAAGTGKSYLAMSYLFSRLEKGDIDRIIIFCNTIATAGAAKLGFYPGSREEKLLDSQIGNFLSSKLGDKIAVEKMIQEQKIELLPMSDIRGYDTTGLKAGIYITEAQNLDIELMRLALQRVGEDSICILDGDSDAQVDLSIYAGNNNGMRRISEVFRDHSIYGEVTLANIYRSEIAKLAQLM